MRFGLIGRDLGLSFSKEIHEAFAPHGYSLRTVAEEDLGAFMKNADFSGINVTMPYKEKVLPYLYNVSEAAKNTGVVNTVVNDGGRLCGYNTDLDGLRALFARAGVFPAGKKVLILGTGATSKTADVLCRAEGAKQVLKVSFSGKPGALSPAEAAKLHGDTQILVNATPAGAGDADKAPVGLDGFPGLEAVIDVVYNPLRTRLILEAEERGLAAAGGLYMLVFQAARSEELFTGETIPREKIDRVYKDLLSRERNVVLTGMPSCGKTAVGRLIAEKTGKEFVDLDGYIGKKTGKSPAELIVNEGEAAFRALEKTAVRELLPKRGAVIAAGGGTVLDEENVRRLKANGKVFFLDRPLEALTPGGGRPLSDTPEKLRELYALRRPRYLEAADAVVTANGVKECARAVLEDLF